MAIIRVEYSPGGDLILIDSSGERSYAYKANSGLWYLSGQGVTPGPTPEYPDELTVNDCQGVPLTLVRKQLGYAATIYGVASALGLNAEDHRHATVIAFMTVFVESVWRMYANSNVPASLAYPHDAIGSDNDSLGLFQQRPSIPWGTVAQLMDVTYNAQAFFGGDTGPNAGNPPGLLDLTGWRTMTYGEAAQAVQGSAFPDRYACWRSAADAVYDALSVTPEPSGDFVWPFIAEPSPAGDMPPDGDTNQPLAEYGPRELTGRFHEGIDFGYNHAVNGATITAAGSGSVHVNEYRSAFGNVIIINHGQNSDGATLYTLYAHRQAIAGPAVGGAVTQGDAIGLIGQTGNVTGPHLHFETHVVPAGGVLTWNINDPSGYRTAIDPRVFMAEYGS